MGCRFVFESAIAAVNHAFETDGLSSSFSGPAGCVLLQRAGCTDQDIVGITNSAPARMPVGQRLVIVFIRV